MIGTIILANGQFGKAVSRQVDTQARALGYGWATAI